MRAELPMALYSQFPAQAAEARRESTGEWSASCPFCGGKDRFRIFAESKGSGARYWCRVCGRKGFLDRKLTQQERDDLRLKRVAQREVERRQRLKRVAQLTESAYWRGYHDALRDVARAEWLKRGVPVEAQDYFTLGYTPSLEWHSAPALTIPFHGPAWDVETVQYRLLGVEGSGKYRFEKGYPATAFWTATDSEDWPFILAEGAIKSIILWWTLCVQGSARYNVVAVPNKTPGRDVLESLGEAVGDRTVYVLLDPDATQQEQARVGAYFDAARYVALPGKVDDMLLDGLRPERIESLYLAQATLDPL